MARGVPTTADLVEALRGFLEQDVMPGTEGRLSFMARVAANVAATVEREIVLGSEQERGHVERLAALGFADDDELARAIRAGELDDRLDGAIEVTRRNVVEKLSLWNPRYVEPEDADLILQMPDSNPRDEGR
ncbi:MAG TPA: DUF6285 domain-containing protein [Solirubrobacterales bacterium]|jgi:hypothetical protein